MLVSPSLALPSFPADLVRTWLRLPFPPTPPLGMRIAAQQPTIDGRRRQSARHGSVGADEGGAAPGAVGRALTQSQAPDPDTGFHKCTSEYMVLCTEYVYHSVMLLLLLRLRIQGQIASPAALAQSTSFVPNGYCMSCHRRRRIWSICLVRAFRESLIWSGLRFLVPVAKAKTYGKNVSGSLRFEAFQVHLLSSSW